MGSKQRAVFLDRDGTLMEEVNYCRRPEDVHLFPGVREALRMLKNAGFLNIIITNQAGIGRGYFSLSDYEAVHAAVLHHIGPGLIDRTYFCPDHPDHASSRRKPGIGMLLEAAADLNLELASSFLIGDKASDIECAERAGLRSVLVATGYGSDQQCLPDFRSMDLSDAVAWILRQPLVLRQ